MTHQLGGGDDIILDFYTVLDVPGQPADEFIRMFGVAEAAVDTNDDDLVDDADTLVEDVGGDLVIDFGGGVAASVTTRCNCLVTMPP